MVRTGDTDIYLVDPNYGSLINLTRSPKSEERYPNWSPDGKHIAFTSDRNGTYDLYVMDADGSHVRQLTHYNKPPAEAYFPTWAPDSKTILYNAQTASMAGVVCRINIDGTGYHEIGPGRDADMSPDGKTIAFTNQVGNGYVVFTMSADGSNVRQITQHEDVLGAVTPTWSRDGRYIVYSDTVGKALELFQVDRDGKHIRQLTHLGQIATCPDFSPDGKWITFRVTDVAYWHDPQLMKETYEMKLATKRPVWVMRADGSNAHILEALRYQCAMDGSRAVWKPRPATHHSGSSR